jgi:chaperonin GroES
MTDPKFPYGKYQHSGAARLALPKLAKRKGPASELSDEIHRLRAPLQGSAKLSRDATDDQDYDDAQEPDESGDALSELREWAKSPNLAGDDDFPASKLAAIGQRAVEEYRLDRESRSEWEDMAKHAVESIPQKSKPKSYPWPNASNVRNPNTTIACLRWAADAFPAVVDGPKIVKYAAFGRDDDQESAFRGERISTFLSWQLLHQMPEWQDDTNVLLHQLPALGCAFRKVYPDKARKRHRSEMISAFDLVVHNNTTSLESCPRISHRYDLYPHEIETKSRCGEFIKLTPGELDGALLDDNPNPGRTPIEPGRDPQAAQEFIEQHRWEDLDGDGLAEPWIFTVHLASQKVVRVQANYDLDSATVEDGKVIYLPRFDYFIKYGFIPDPRGGFYDLGYYEIARSVSEAIDTTINQSLDAAHLQNAGGGFIGSGLNLKKTQFRFSPGQYHTVGIPGTAIRDAIVNVEHPGPSPVGLQLLEKMDGWMQALVSSEGTLGAESLANVAVGTALAQTEAALKVFKGIYKRLYRSLSKEYALLAKLNFRYPNDELYLKILNWKPSAPADQPGLAGQMTGPTAQSAQPNGLPSALPAGLPPLQQGGAAPSGPGPLEPSGSTAIPAPGGAPAPQAMMQPPSMSVDFAPDEISRITPTADPSMVTAMQVLQQAQFLMELAAHPALGPLLPKVDAMKQILRAAKQNELAEKIQEPGQAGEQAQQALAAAKAADLQAGAQKKGMEAQLAAAKIDQVHSGIVKTGFDMKSGAVGQYNESLSAAHTAALTAKEVEQARTMADHQRGMDAHKATLDAHAQTHNHTMDLMQHEHDVNQAHRQHALDVAGLQQQQQQLDQAAQQAQQTPAQDGA